MKRPFELPAEEPGPGLDRMVEATFGDLQSQFLVLPKGPGFIEFGDFQTAYETLKRLTDDFRKFDRDAIWGALEENSLCFVILRTILGVSPPEWADLAQSDLDSDVDSGSARSLDVKVRKDRGVLARARKKRGSATLPRVEALVTVAVDHIQRGAPEGATDTVHRLAKADTARGLESVRRLAEAHVPYPVLLYERYLGRPFASHRDSVSGLVGDVMESAIEERLTRARIPFRKTKLAERVSGFDQAPDFFVPTEVAPEVVIEAKITGDEGTTRDKVARVLRLASMRDERVRRGDPGFELVACVDGRGFGVRKQDMRDLLRATRGKVFTLTTLDHLIENTDLKRFLPKA